MTGGVEGACWFNRAPSLSARARAGKPCRGSSLASWVGQEVHSRASATLHPTVQLKLRGSCVLEPESQCGRWMRRARGNKMFVV